MFERKRKQKTCTTTIKFLFIFLYWNKENPMVINQTHYLSMLVRQFRATRETLFDTIPTSSMPLINWRGNEVYHDSCDVLAALS